MQQQQPQQQQPGSAALERRHDHTSSLLSNTVSSPVIASLPCANAGWGQQRSDNNSSSTNGAGNMSLPLYRV
jgi:hypothetical protein